MLITVYKARPTWGNQPHTVEVLSIPGEERVTEKIIGDVTEKVNTTMLQGGEWSHQAENTKILNPTLVPSSFG